MASEPQTVEVDGETYEYDAEDPWKDADLLRMLYWEKGMSQRGVGGVFGCSGMTVGRWMDKLDIEARKPPCERPPTFYQNEGYERWSHGKHIVGVHRLLAVAEYGLDAICGNHVHHENHIPWDNRPQNIEVKSPQQHQRDHSDEEFEHNQTPWREADKLREMYVGKQLSTTEIADVWGCDRKTVNRWLNKHGIETRSRSEAMKLIQQDDNQQQIDEDTLRELYVEQQMNQYEIGEELGCNQRTVCRWLDKHGIEKRSKSEAQQLRHADDNQQQLDEAAE